MEKKRPLTKQDRRQRQKLLEQARRQQRLKPAQESPPAEHTTAADPAPSLEASSNKAGRRRKREVKAADLSGLKYFQKLRPLLEPLHKVGCERDKSDNRDLHCDDLCLFLPETLTLVDGTLLSALPLLIQAMGLKQQTGSGLVKWRLHTHFEVDARRCAAQGVNRVRDARYQATAPRRDRANPGRLCGEHRQRDRAAGARARRVPAEPGLPALEDATGSRRSPSCPPPSATG